MSDSRNFDSPIFDCAIKLTTLSLPSASGLGNWVNSSNLPQTGHVVPKEAMLLPA